MLTAVKFTFFAITSISQDDKYFSAIIHDFLRSLKYMVTLSPFDPKIFRQWELNTPWHCIKQGKLVSQCCATGPRSGFLWVLIFIRIGINWYKAIIFVHSVKIKYCTLEMWDEIVSNCSTTCVIIKGLI